MKITIKKKNIVLAVSSFILGLVLIWFSISLYFIVADKDYVFMFINLEGNTLVEKVRNDFPNKTGEDTEYTFSVILEEIVDNKASYEITGVPLNYQDYYETRDDSRFKYSLEKSKGSFNINEFQINDPYVITLKYEVKKNFEYFLDYSYCTLKRAYSNLFNIDSSCARGNCLINRELSTWTIEPQNEGVTEKASFISKYDQELLVRGLTNYYITDYFGYFDGVSFKSKSRQISKADGTYQLSSETIDEAGEGNSISIFWVLERISKLVSEESSTYKDINLEEYMKKIYSYSDSTEEISNYFWNCETSYRIISNLSSCTSSSCEEIKEGAFNYCKSSLDKELSIYSQKYEGYSGYGIDGAKQAFLFYMPSELIYYNKNVDILKIGEQKYSETEINKYYVELENIANKYPSTITDCFLLENTADMYDEYGLQEYINNKERISSTLPDFNTLCNGDVKNDYCNLTVAEKLVCADAMLSFDKDTARIVLNDIFYRHYFASPGALKINSIENIKENGIQILPEDKKEYSRLDDYGYFVSRMAVETNNDILVVTYTDILDSYYFINILEDLTDE